MSSNFRPRMCVLEKGDNGYGFHLHGEKGKPGQFIRHVESDSPAASAGLLAGDKLVFVNGVSVEDERHQQVVANIRAVTGKLELIVIDPETAELLQKHNLKCQKEYVTDGIPIPSSAGSDHEDEVKNGTSRDSTPLPETNGDLSLDRLSVSSKESKNEMRPRLCHMKKGATGFGFNLHTEKTKPGQYIRAVDDDSPAEKSGLRPQDRIVQVNGVSVHGLQHSEVVAAIKEGGEETSLLVVDPEADAFFTSCQVLPTEKHLTGPLPEPVVSHDIDGQVRVDVNASLQVNGKSAQEEKPRVSVSLSNSSTTSNTSTSAAPTSILAPEAQKSKETASDEDKELSVSLSLQQAKERARQKRSNKKAPPMDWSKRNELFSNL